MEEIQCCHKHLARFFTKIIREPENFPKFVSEGVTYLIPKETPASDNPWPITCLCTAYKLLTSILTNKIYSHLEKNDLLDEEQKGCRKISKGYHEQLIIDSVITGNAKKNKKPLYCAYIDYQKAFDTVPHSWLIEVLRIFRIDEHLVTFLQSTMSQWRTRLIIRGSETMISDPISINKGIFQGDALSALWFCLALKPLTITLNSTRKGYAMDKQTRISHLLYMDDLKLYAETEESIKVLINTTVKYSKDIGMSIGFEKCRTSTMVNGNWQQPEGYGTNDPKLEDPREINGLFLVRESVSSPSDYVLSVLWDNQVNNYQIRRHQEDAFFSINELIKFHGLENLIDYYKKNPLSEDGLILTEYVKGSQPPHETRRSGSCNLLHRATNEGDYMVVTELLQSGYVGCDAKNQDGKTAAHLAAIKGQNDILRKLIFYQVKVSSRDATGFTPLHYACKYNRVDTVRLLVTLGKVNIQARSTENGEVPLHVAASEGHIDVVKELLSLNAPVNPRTKKGFVPAQLARKKGHIECAKLLESYKCPPPKLSRNQFYHGTLDRLEAEEKIRNFSPQSGVYLVRYSESIETYILSLFHEKVCNYIIRKHEDYLVIDDGPLLNSLEHLVEYYSTLPDGLPTVLTTPVPPPPKPIAPPISTLKKQKQKTIRPKLKVPQVEEPSSDGIPSSNIFQNICFQSDLSTVNNVVNNNNNNIHHHEDKEDKVILPERLKRGTLIGEGEFASVFEGILINKNGEEVEVAIKTLRNEHSKSSRDNFIREAEVMINLKHHCIVKLLGICLGRPLQMIQELVPLGSILQYIDSHRNEINPDFEFKIWAAQIACGMHYLEENRFVHRDLAARNILLSTKFQAKISDFGLSRALETDHEYYRALQGGRWPLKWYAPESYNYGQFDHKSDVWSFGVTIWEIYSFGASPYGDIKGVEAIVLIDKGERLPKPEACSDTIYNKMLECWEFDKDKRPTFKELTEFFQCDPEYMNIKVLVPEVDVA